MTLEEVIAAKDNAVLPEFSGLITSVGKPDEKTNNLTGGKYLRQIVRVKDGAAEVAVSISGPQHQPCGILTEEHVGRKLVFKAAPSPQKPLDYLKRGQTVHGANGKTHWVFAAEKAEVSFASAAPAPSTLLALAEAEDDDGFSFENATPAPAKPPVEPKPEPKAEPKPEPKADDKSTAHTQAQWKPTNPNPAAALQLVEANYRQCLDRAIIIINEAVPKMGTVTGTPVDAESATVISVANVLFTEACRRNVW